MDLLIVLSTILVLFNTVMLIFLVWNKIQARRMTLTFKETNEPTSRSSHL